MTAATVWNRVNSHTLFLRRDAVAQAGRFDESLGLGSGQPWHSGEETDFVVGALQAGARIEYDPSFVVVHPQRRPTAPELRALGATRASGKPETGFRVFIDPVGHPFCIVFGRHSAG